MKLLIIATLLVSSAFSQVINTVNVTNNEGFTIFNRTNNGGIVFYSCDIVEYATRDLLQALGATDVSARCTGGFTPWGTATPANVSVTFTSKMISEDGEGEGYFETFQFNRGDNCHLYENIFRNIKNNFAFENYDVMSPCFRGNDRFRLSGSVLK